MQLRMKSGVLLLQQSVLLLQQSVLFMQQSGHAVDGVESVFWPRFGRVFIISGYGHWDVYNILKERTVYLDWGTLSRDCR
jgi:hypothetical protein